MKTISIAKAVKKKTIPGAREGDRNRTHVMSMIIVDPTDRMNVSLAAV